jgi:hypothetical protein
MASNKNLPKIAAAGGAGAVLAAGAWILGTSGSDASATASTQGPPGMAQGAPPQNGQAPRGAPGFGSDIGGTTAEKVAKAATASYPGQVERVMQLSDGSYVAHVITSSGEVHVAVSKDFQVTGTEQGGPPMGGTPPSGATPPSGGTTPPSGTTTPGTTSTTSATQS